MTRKGFVGQVLTADDYTGDGKQAMQPAHSPIPADVILNISAARRQKYSKQPGKPPRVKPSIPQKGYVICPTCGCLLANQQSFLDHSPFCKREKEVRG